MSAIKAGSSKKKASKRDAELESASSTSDAGVPEASDKGESEAESADSDDLDQEDVAPKKRSKDVRFDGDDEAGPSTSTGSAGSRQSLKYKVPKGMMAVQVPVQFASSAFEYDALLSKPGVELWAIRAPGDLKASRLSALSITLSTSGPSGTLSTKSQTYSLRSAGKQPVPHLAVDEEGRQPTAGPGLADAMTMDTDGGNEMRFEGGAEMTAGLGLMVPRMSKGGKLFPAPIPISRHLLLEPQISSSSNSASHDASTLPSLLATAALDAAVQAEIAASARPVKREQPTHLLKFRNHAIGSATIGPGHSTSKAPEVTGVSAAAVEEKEEVDVDSHVLSEVTPSAAKKKRKSAVDEGTPAPVKKKKVKA